MEHRNERTKREDDGFLFPDAAQRQGETNAEDRRTFERYDYRQHVSVVWLENGHVQRRVSAMLAADISRGGLKLVGRQMIHRDAVGVVLLKTVTGQTMLRGIRVMHCVYAGDLLYASGCEFVPAHEKLLRAVKVVNGEVQFSTRPEDFI